MSNLASRRDRDTSDDCRCTGGCLVRLEHLCNDPLAGFLAFSKAIGLANYLGKDRLTVFVSDEYG